MADAKRKNYLNKIYIKKTWEDENDAGNVLLSAGILRDEFIKELMALPVTEKGYVNLTFGRQKGDPSKWSAWTDDYVKNQQATGFASTTPSTDNDSLPF